MPQAGEKDQAEARLAAAADPEGPFEDWRLLLLAEMAEEEGDLAAAQAWYDRLLATCPGFTGCLINHPRQPECWTHTLLRSDADSFAAFDGTTAWPSGHNPSTTSFGLGFLLAFRIIGCQ